MTTLLALYAWLTAHWLAIFSGWVVANTVASTLENKLGPVPTNTWYGKALHVFVAISPMDVMKALKALGGALVPPSAGAVAGTMVLCLALGLGVTGCGSSTPTSTQPQVDPRALADAATSLMETAWKDAAQACLDAANAAHDDSIRQKCEPPLTKAREALLTAQSAIDVWGAAEQKNFPCLVAGAVEGLANVSALGNFKVPQSLVDALNLAQQYAGQCPTLTADAGGQ